MAGPRKTNDAGRLMTASHMCAVRATEIESLRKLLEVARDLLAGLRFDADDAADSSRDRIVRSMDDVLEGDTSANIPFQPDSSYDTEVPEPVVKLANLIVRAFFRAGRVSDGQARMAASMLGLRGHHRAWMTRAVGEVFLGIIKGEYVSDDQLKQMVERAGAEPGTKLYRKGLHKTRRGAKKQGAKIIPITPEVRTLLEMDE